MIPNKPICKPCAVKAKSRGYLTHHLSPPLLNRRHKIRCCLCGQTRYLYRYLNYEFRNHPRKVRVPR